MFNVGGHIFGGVRHDLGSSGVTAFNGRVDVGGRMDYGLYGSHDHRGSEAF